MGRNVMRSMKRDLKSANLILQENKKTKFTSKFCTRKFGIRVRFKG